MSYSLRNRKLEVDSHILQWHLKKIVEHHEHSPTGSLSGGESDSSTTSGPAQAKPPHGTSGQSSPTRRSPSSRSATSTAQARSGRRTVDKRPTSRVTEDNLPGVKSDGTLGTGFFFRQCRSESSSFSLGHCCPFHTTEGAEPDFHQDTAVQIPTKQDSGCVLTLVVRVLHLCSSIDILSLLHVASTIGTSPGTSWFTNLRVRPALPSSLSKKVLPWQSEIGR